MSRYLSALFIIALSIIACQEKEMSTNLSKHAMLRHVVLFKFNDKADADKVKEIEEAFTNLSNTIDVIQDFEWGLNNSPEGLNKGLTHCFLLTFKSEEDRDIYLPHPEHKKFGELIGPYLEDVTVVDYWAK